MHIVVDANVLIADPWLKSQRLRVLFDYAAKTRSRLILLETVEREVAAHVQRQFEAAADAIALSLRQAERVGLAGVPAVDAPAMARDTLAAWEAAFRRALNPSVADRVPTEPAIVPELVRRAAYRLPPVRPNGRETRDTILWLALVAFLKGRRSHEWCAFISQNTEDFAAADGVSLRPDLAPDLVGVPGTFTYYPSVDAFLKEHAEPIRHVTQEWVLERLDLARIRTAMDERLIRAIISRSASRVLCLPGKHLSARTGGADTWGQPGTPADVGPPLAPRRRAHRRLPPAPGAERPDGAAPCGAAPSSCRAGRGVRPACGGGARPRRARRCPSRAGRSSTARGPWSWAPG